jgi:hypothetical protein
MICLAAACDQGLLHSPVRMDIVYRRYLSAACDTPSGSVAVHDLDYHNPRHASPVEPSVVLRRDGVVVKHEHQPFPMDQINGQLAFPLSIPVEPRAAGLLSRQSPV